MDTLSPKQRSERMALIKGKNTKPEMLVRSLVHKLGYRFRLHKKDLPGTPDLVFTGKKKVIFVHGCFWHRHESCTLARLPKSRIDFWRTKLESNKKRDDLKIHQLHELGWDALVIWECELRDTEKLVVRLKEFLG